VNPELSGIEAWRKQADQTIKDLVAADELSQQSVNRLLQNLSEYRNSSSETETGE